MSDILTLARAVAEELREYKAELLYFPEFELRDLDDLRIVVFRPEHSTRHFPARLMRNCRKCRSAY